MTGTFGSDSVAILRDLRRARIQRGDSQQKIADLIGVSVRTFGSWEGGATEPSMSQLCRWARLVGRKLQMGEIAPAGGAA